MLNCLSKLLLLTFVLLCLVNKLSRFQELVSESNWNFDIIGITWDLEDRIIMTCFPYQIITNHIKNIEKKTGGVLLYIRDSIHY